MHRIVQKHLRAIATTIVGGALAAVLAAPAFAAPLTQTRLNNADNEPHNWLMNFQNYGSQRFSRLAQINSSNVQNLKVAYTMPMVQPLIGRTSLDNQASGLVEDGFMYIDAGGGFTYKFDLRSGTKATYVWEANTALPTDQSARTRGHAMMGESIYMTLRDARVVSINRNTGEIQWDQQIGKVAHPKAQTEVGTPYENFNAAAIAAEGKLIVGNAGGDSGGRGWLAAVNAADGKEVWRFYTIPGPGEQGFETWKDTNQAWKTGGGGMWTTGSYDVATRATIWGVGQPMPMHDPEFRPGDNLFSNAAIALDIDTGKLKWFFQYTPNESWDYDEQGVHMLYDLPNATGGTRPVIGHYSRSGFYYQLDRSNGAFLSATQYVDVVNWTKGIDPKTGKPMEYNPNMGVQAYLPETRRLRGQVGANFEPICPHRLGGVRWQPQAYNPNKRIAYAAGMDGCVTFDVVPVLLEPNGGGIARNSPSRSAIGNTVHHGVRGVISAVDVVTGRQIAKVSQPYENRAGVLATAGNLVFSGTLDGAVTAHDDQTLAELWRFETGISIKAAPISFSVNGKQFIAIIAAGGAPGGGMWPELGLMKNGGALYVFSL